MGKNVYTFSWLYLSTCFFAFFSYPQNLSSQPAEYSENWQYFLEKGKIEIQEQMYEYALENLERTYKLNPQSIEALNLLAEWHLLHNNRHRALAYILESLSLDENQPVIHFRAGELYDYFNAPAQAKEHFENSHKLDPNNALAMIGLARSYSLLNERLLSNEIFTKAENLAKQVVIDIMPDINELQKKGQHKEVIARLAPIVKNNPAATELVYILAAEYRLDGQPIKAYELYERQKYFRPHHPKAYLYIAELLYSQHVFSDRKKELLTAIDNLKIAILLDSENPHYYEILSDIYREMGMSVNEREASIKASELYKKNQIQQ